MKKPWAWFSILFVSLWVTVPFCARGENADTEAKPNSPTPSKLTLEGSGPAPDSKRKSEESSSISESACPKGNATPAPSIEPVGSDVVAEALRTLTAINGILAKRSPSLLKDLSAEAKANLINAFLKGVNSDLVFIPTESSSADSALNSESSCKNDNAKELSAKPATFPAVTIASNKLCYARLDSFSADAINALSENLNMIANLSTQPVGVVIDVRNCDDLDSSRVSDMIEWFSSTSSKRDASASGKVASLLKRPVLMLTGDRTRGGGEILAKKLRSSKKCLILGGDTAGEPFRKKTAPVDGGTLVFPFPSSNYSDVSFKPLKADVPIPPYPQLPYEAVSGDPAEMTEDECLTRAIDLLICLDALKNKKQEDRNERKR